MENGGSILLSTGCWRAVDPSSCTLYCAYCCLYVKTNGEWWIYPSLHYNFGSFHRLLESGGSILPMGNGGSILYSLLCTIILATSTGCWGAVDPFSCILYCAHCCLYVMTNGEWWIYPSFYRLLESGGSILLCTEVYLLIPVSGLGKRITGKFHKT
jgi:hypothetical protein